MVYFVEISHNNCDVCGIQTIFRMIEGVSHIAAISTNENKNANRKFHGKPLLLKGITHFILKKTNIHKAYRVHSTHHLIEHFCKMYESICKCFFCHSFSFALSVGLHFIFILFIHSSSIFFLLLDSVTNYVFFISK